MNRWKSLITLLLITMIIITSSMISYAGEGQQISEDKALAVYGEGNENASSDAPGDTSGNASGEGQKEYVTLSFYVSDTCVKTLQIEKGSVIELWIPEGPSYATFAGWYTVVGEHRYSVTETTTFNQDTVLIADWNITNWKGIDFKEIEQNVELQRQSILIQQETKISQVEIKNITIKKKKGKVSLKIRSSLMPASPIELQYSTSKKFTKSKTKTKVIKRTKNKSVKTFKNVTIKKLKKNKTYYIRARVKSEYNGQTYYSQWSKVQKVTMKGKKKQKK